MQLGDQSWREYANTTALRVEKSNALAESA